MKTLRQRLVDALKRESRLVRKLIKNLPKSSAGLRADVRETLTAALWRDFNILQWHLKRLMEQQIVCLRDFRFGPTTFWYGVNLRSARVDPHLQRELEDWMQNAEDDEEQLW